MTKEEILIIKNEIMELAEYGDYLIAFWGGKSRGTKNMIDQMKKLDKDYTIINI